MTPIPQIGSRIAFPSLCIAFVVLAGCSSSDDNGENVATSPLAGKVGGQTWTFQIGATDAFLSEGEDDFFAALYAESYTPCTGIEPTSPHLLVSVPKQPGSYDFGTMRNITFVTAGDDNLISLSGQIVVDSVTATMITGGVRSHRDDSNDVNGQFQLTICPDDSARSASGLR